MAEPTQEQIGRIAQEAVQVFLTGVSGGRQVAICDNPQCRVALYVVEAGLGTRIPLCPACYGAAPDKQDGPAGVGG